MLKTLESPRLQVLSGQEANPFSRGLPQEAQPDIDGVPVDDLLTQYGSPLFVFSERELLHNLRVWKQAFAPQYSPVTFGWSYKTNYLRGICKVFHEQGSLAEVVSEMEYRKARKTGMEGDEIILNGPHKPKHLLQLAFAEGARVHVDSFDEIDDILELAETSSKEIHLGIRINLDAGIQPVWSRFGFHLESGEAKQALEQLLSHKRIHLAGLHTHIGTYILEPAAYGVAARKCLELAYWAEDQFGERIQYLDLGGGFPSPARLKGLYHSPEIYLPKPEAYAEAIGKSLQTHLRPGHRPELLLESGRALVDSAGTLLTSVLSRKTCADGRNLYVMDAGVNLLYTASWYELEPGLTRPHEEEAHSSQLAGPLCMNIDMLHTDCALPPLERGEALRIPNVGAYNVTQSMQFIALRPAVVLLKETGDVEILREAETLDRLEAGEPV